MPPELRHKNKYILIDGHHRRDAAIQAELDVPCVLYDPEEEILIEEHGLADFYLASTDNIYDFCLDCIMGRKVVG